MDRNGERRRAPASILRVPGKMGPLILLIVLSFSSAALADALGRVGSLTPAGLWLAYTARTDPVATVLGSIRRYSATGMLPDFATGTQLRVANTRTGMMMQVNDWQGVVADPIWAPDGKQLAFYSDRGGIAHLWVWNRETNQVKQLSDAIARPSFQSDAKLAWTPDSTKVVALVLPKGVTVQQANARILSGVPEADQSLGAMSADLALIDAATGDLKRLVQDKIVFWYAPSPDGRYIAYSYVSGRAQGSGRWLFNVEVAVADSGASRMVAESTYADDGALAWSPDSTRLAYFASGTRGKNGVRVIEVESKSDREATSITFSTPGPNDAHRRVLWTPDGAGVMFVFNGKLWSASPQTGEIMTVTVSEWNREVVQIVGKAQSGEVWTRDKGRSVTVTTRDPANQNMGFYRVEIATGKVTKLREEAARYGDHTKPAVSSEDGTFVMWAAEDARSAMDLWGAGPNLKEALKLTQLAPR